ncbi:NAD(P)H-hydrate dehydratase [Anaeromassilibacillus sp. An172]|uniref:NAD(P)H-hydrate dehydratase n=1 Tax=Anaeromassilibacillus sp. An172 TaxID=1965570 RepID=UPI000B38F6E3|nr:NAD(P)H-hydrate dehydratase [Anaeromassilibacillus sp. An172]OUP79263.1 NAD(P)H-hydrate dehydratase [Anaeromassilibacillus sp. An172]
MSNNTPLITKEFLKDKIKSRPIDSNKGTFGNLLAICGSYGMAGAAMMAAMGALRSGVGLMRLAIPESIYPIAAVRLPECVFHPIKTTDKTFSQSNCTELLKLCETASAVVLGCGMGWNFFTSSVTERIVESCAVPMVIDADGLNCVSEHIDILNSAKAPVIITPHPGEMARLTKTTIEEVQSNRIECACNFAKKYNVITVLKGAGTVVASPTGEHRVNTTGNPGMSTGGSGDILAGIAGSLLAQGYSPFDAACLGVFVHGLAGDITAKQQGMISMLPTDTLRNIGKAFFFITDQ